jgi:hypothetical protein
MFLHVCPHPTTLPIHEKYPKLEGVKGTPLWHNTGSGHYRLRPPFLWEELRKAITLFKTAGLCRMSEHMFDSSFSVYFLENTEKGKLLGKLNEKIK